MMQTGCTCLVLRLSADCCLPNKLYDILTVWYRNGEEKIFLCIELKQMSEEKEKDPNVSSNGRN